MENKDMYVNDFSKSVAEFPQADLALDTLFQDQAVSTLTSQLTSSHVFLLGEMHGVYENPAVAYSLMKKFDINSFALEWDENRRPAITNFLKTGNIDTSKFAKSSDGRITSGHFALFQRLAKENLLDQIILFDQEYDGDWNKRDKNMAQHILNERNPNSNLLIFAGDLHIQTKSLKFKDDPEDKYPMGWHLLQGIPNMPVGAIKYQSGEFFNLTKKSFKSINTVNSKPTFILHDNEYQYTLPKAKPAIVPGLMN